MAISPERIPDGGPIAIGADLIVIAALHSDDRGTLMVGSKQRPRLSVIAKIPVLTGRDPARQRLTQPFKVKRTVTKITCKLLCARRKKTPRLAPARILGAVIEVNQFGLGVLGPIR